MPSQSNYQIVFLIGAARSGTKILRDTITLNSCIDKVPYDVNYIWRLGNEDFPHDELTPELLTPEKISAIHQNIGKYHDSSSLLIEKTVSNCLRIPFVETVFPGALYIHLVRDGMDVVESSYRQWRARPDWRYIAKKVLTFPMNNAFGYGITYVRKMVQKLLLGYNSKPPIWGPQYLGIEQDLASKTLLEVCAIQWARSVELALFGLSNIPTNRVFHLRYYDLVRYPENILRNLLLFLGIQTSFDSVWCHNISKENIGKGRYKLTQVQYASILPYVEKTNRLLRGSDCFASAVENDFLKNVVT